MIVKNFTFYKAEKIPATMEVKLNEFLKDNSFRFATQNESATTKKVAISIFAEPADDKVKATVKAKAFRGATFEEIQTKVNEFLATKVKMKFCTQSFVENNITTIVFFE